MSATLALIVPPLFLGGQCFVPLTLRLIENLLTRLFWKITICGERRVKALAPGMGEAAQAMEQEAVPREEQVPQYLEISMRVVRVQSIRA